MVNWVSVKDALPLTYLNVLVKGGVAYWDGEFWYSCVERCHPRIQWDVEYWALLPKPPDTCSNCTRLKAKLTELKAQVESL